MNKPWLILKGNLASGVTWDPVRQASDSETAEEDSQGPQLDGSAGPSLGMEEPLWHLNLSTRGAEVVSRIGFVVSCFANSPAEPPPPPFPDRGYLFLVTSLKLPGGMASKTWWGLVSLAGASPPCRAQRGSQRVGSCRGEEGGVPSTTHEGP